MDDTNPHKGRYARAIHRTTQRAIRNAAAVGGTPPAISHHGADCGCDSHALFASHRWQDTDIAGLPTPANLVPDRYAYEYLHWWEGQRRQLTPLGAAHGVRDVALAAYPVSPTEASSDILPTLYGLSDNGSARTGFVAFWGARDITVDPETTPAPDTSGHFPAWPLRHGPLTLDVTPIPGDYEHERWMMGVGPGLTRNNAHAMFVPVTTIDEERFVITVVFSRAKDPRTPKGAEGLRRVLRSHLSTDIVDYPPHAFADGIIDAIFDPDNARPLEVPL